MAISTSKRGKSMGVALPILGQMDSCFLYHVYKMSATNFSCPRTFVGISFHTRGFSKTSMMMQGPLLSLPRAFLALSVLSWITFFPSFLNVIVKWLLPAWRKPRFHAREPEKFFVCFSFNLAGPKESRWFLLGQLLSRLNFFLSPLLLSYRVKH